MTPVICVPLHPNTLFTACIYSTHGKWTEARFCKNVLTYNMRSAMASARARCVDGSKINTAHILFSIIHLGCYFLEHLCHFKLGPDFFPFSSCYQKHNWSDCQDNIVLLEKQDMLGAEPQKTPLSWNPQQKQVDMHMHRSTLGIWSHTACVRTCAHTLPEKNNQYGHAWCQGQTPTCGFIKPRGHNGLYPAADGFALL